MTDRASPTGRPVGPTPAQAVESAFRREWGRVVAALIRRTGDWDLAEESAAEAYARALVVWPRDGVPDRPGAWLTTVAGHCAVDRRRRARRGGELLRGMTADPSDPAGAETEDPEMERLFDDAEEIEDDRLRLIFTCCHPALALPARVALTLRALGGLTTAEIARAFLVPEATMAKRLTRAKAKISGAGIPYRVPPARLLSERTAGVLAVIYLVFNEGYAASGGPSLIRSGLCAEAMSLGSAMVALMPDEPEATGLLALMTLQHARRDARVDAAGDLVTLEEQDRGRWRSAEIDAGARLLEGALRRRAVGPYQLQAAIAACHARAPDAAATDWAQIAGLYGLLAAVAPTPVVTLNRAVAVAMAGDLDGGLGMLDELAADGILGDFHLLSATRADLLRRRGDTATARAAYVRALALAPTEPERRYLRRRLGELRRAGQEVVAAPSCGSLVSAPGDSSRPASA